MISPADTLWVLSASAMVLLMTPGLALFYGGLVARRNVLSTKLHSFFAISLISLQWVVIGYSLSFAEGNLFVGGLDYFLMASVGTDPGPFAETIPHVAFASFQMMFAIFTPAIISGAFAERMTFRAYILFTLLWATFIYDPICHWVWGAGGWLADLGALDFAGGTVVHISSGVAGLAVAIALGPRKGVRTAEAAPPHNMSFVVLGAGLLWIGWFGFNAGSTLSAGKHGAHVFLMTHIAASAGALTWAMIESIYRQRVTALGVASGGVAGLVSITPACGFVNLPGALAIGVGAGAICYFGVMLKDRLGFDDALDAFGLHGIGGAWGAIATGIFAVSSVGGTAGLLEGNAEILGIQVISVLATGTYSFAGTWLIVKVVDLAVGLRVTEAEEAEGLDRAVHGEQGYAL